ncbi:MAG TPA: AI-2E family transporter [Acetobacteraceae bacterium]|jgi:predicted PurR-regulated permease PerM|nr:AI-2E family transporter [Acetobacteraceae bacterium]
MSSSVPPETGAINDLTDDGEPLREMPEAEPVHFSSDPLVVLQTAQFTLLLIGALYLTRTIVLPIVLAILLKLLLQSGVRRLERIHIPRAIAALLMITILFVTLVSMGTALSGPAHDWVVKLPDSLPRLRERLSFISGSVATVQHFLQNAERYISFSTSQVAPAAPTTSGLSEVLFAGTASFASGLFMTVVVLFFLLVSGDLFLRRLVEVLPRFRDKRAAVMITQQIESNIAAYLKTITIMNASVGVATGLMAWALGLDNPTLWGVLAFVLNYIPVIGPIICLVILVLAGMLETASLWRSLLPAACFLAIHLIEGQFVTPMLVARRFTLNPVLVIVSLIFWYWMWGVPGAILAVPVLAIIKIICDGIPPWAAVGHLVEG